MSRLSTPRLIGPTDTEAVASGPGGRRWLSALNPSSSAFCNTTDRPKVTSSGGSRSSPMVRLSTAFCRSQPAPNISGAATSAAAIGCSPVNDTSTRIR